MRGEGWEGANRGNQWRKSVLKKDIWQRDYKPEHHAGSVTLTIGHLSLLTCKMVKAPQNKPRKCEMRQLMSPTVITLPNL